MDEAKLEQRLQDLEKVAHPPQTLQRRIGDRRTSEDQELQIGELLQMCCTVSTATNTHGIVEEIMTKHLQQPCWRRRAHWLPWPWPCSQKVSPLAAFVDIP